MAENVRARRFTAWGSYDKGKPRVRMLLDALLERQLLAAEIHIDVWRGIEDKSVASLLRLLGVLLRLFVGYPVALTRLAMQPRDTVVMLLYPAVIDIIVVWPLARLRGQKIVFDAFISIHDTVVGDRGKLSASGLAARALWHVERAALKLADFVLVDTDEHGAHFSATFDIPRARFVTTLVGAEPLFWNARSSPVAEVLPHGLPARYVLFYGQLIPLHGIATILAAVEATADMPVQWLIVGSGQEEGIIREFVRRRARGNMTWLPWVKYQSLPALIRGATVSLGIFGSSAKAARVIPNKMFQVLAAGGSIITRESPAVLALARRFPGTIRLVPAGNAAALAAAVIAAFQTGEMPAVPLAMRDVLSPGGGIDELLEALDPVKRSGTKCMQ